MKRAITIITIAGLFLFSPYFNTATIKAGNETNQDSQNIGKKGKVILLTGPVGFIQDDNTGITYQFSNYNQTLVIKQGDKVIYTFDPSCGRVIVRAVTR